MDSFYLRLFTDGYLLSHWSRDFEEYCAREDERVLRALVAWDRREFQSEQSAVSALIQTFFQEMWGYRLAGTTDEETYTVYPEYAIRGAGAGGSTGSADAALGVFGPSERATNIPQVVCEFKDIRTALDAQQQRKGNSRSPEKQCADYLREARAQLYGNEPVSPTWAIVTDMNEFRLYHYRTIPHQYERFIIRRRRGDHDEVSLLDEGDDATFKRFLFSRLLSAKSLIAPSGQSELSRLLDSQWVQEREIENAFYLEYKAYREHLYQTLVDYNPDFEGTRGEMVRLTQRLLDRLLFVLYCEDLGAELGFPPNLLRDYLIEVSCDKYYSEDDNAVWERIKTLFRALEQGGEFGDEKIYRFNGGLFESAPTLEGLRIPGFVFCRKNQGATESNLHKFQDTLLFFSASYNFGHTRGTNENTLTLYTLGRIFEQSITELEILEAHAEGRLSLNELNKRKRDGVYYTPEAVTSYIVDQTVGERLRDFRREYGYDSPPEINPHDIQAYDAATEDRRKTPPKVITNYLAFLEKYSRFLDEITVVDPACGSGAFLIQAFDYLYRERLRVDRERARIERQHSLADTGAFIKQILQSNLYGVDINPESIEITKLALWLHTVRPRSPLSVLDTNVRCGNSLVSTDFYFVAKNDDSPQQARFDFQYDVTEFTAEKRERINAFDWEENFRGVFARGGFDCVVSNPPYVKLQNFRKVEPELAEYLRNAHDGQGNRVYESTARNNFDLYLPFIERGTRLLNPHGYMGYIAPSLWLKNNYGVGLRTYVHRTQKLDRWVDFGSYQVFSDATTYTALQFFAGEPKEQVRFVRSSDGDVSHIDWNDPEVAHIPYKRLPTEDPWILVDEYERKVMRRLEEAGPRLGDRGVPIIVGLQTSADHIFHLQRIAPGLYHHRHKNGIEAEVEIEDDIMHPLVDGQIAKRFIVPEPEKWILFPYDVEAQKPRLFTQEEMLSRFPKAWRYLTSQESELRGRESGKMDRDDRWYGYVYPKNLDKQESRKLLVPRLVDQLHVAIDPEGQLYIDNVDVNGILVSDAAALWYLAGILNSRPADYYWRRISKPFRGGFLSANKQFIAPIPIPDGSESDRQLVSDTAHKLQELYSERWELNGRVAMRLNSGHVRTRQRGKKWLFGTTDKSVIESELEKLSNSLNPGARLETQLKDGELTLLANGRPVLSEIYVDHEEQDFLAAQWRQLCRTISVTDTLSAKKLCARISTIAETDNHALRDQVVEIDRKIVELDARIEELERTLNASIVRLYGLTDEERAIVDEG